VATIAATRQYRDRQLWVAEFLAVDMTQDWDTEPLNIVGDFVAINARQVTAISGGAAGTGLQPQVNTVWTEGVAASWLAADDHVTADSTAGAVEAFPIATPSGNDLYHMLFLNQLSPSASRILYNQFRLTWAFGSRTAGVYDFHIIHKPFER